METKLDKPRPTPDERPEVASNPVSSSFLTCFASSSMSTSSVSSASSTVSTFFSSTSATFSSSFLTTWLAFACCLCCLAFSASRSFCCCLACRANVNSRVSSILKVIPPLLGGDSLFESFDIDLTASATASAPLAPLFISRRRFNLRALARAAFRKESSGSSSKTGCSTCLDFFFSSKACFVRSLPLAMIASYLARLFSVLTAGTCVSTPGSDFTWSCISSSSSARRRFLRPEDAGIADSSSCSNNVDLDPEALPLTTMVPSPSSSSSSLSICVFRRFLSFFFFFFFSCLAARSCSSSSLTFCSSSGVGASLIFISIGPYSCWNSCGGRLSPAKALTTLGCSGWPGTNNMAGGTLPCNGFAVTGHTKAISSVFESSNCPRTSYNSESFAT
mmetsp:Transcript_25508/g.73403  ORF Transcript_25508/g.73403 Transcript_25508/m.73403 type:complete len:390 (-) Transcript_25508:401-1570(-)